jgi:dTDP-4-amino-4,6-dideoxygalactose transaminase
MLPVSRPSIGKEELEEVKAVFETGWLGLGSKVFEFENKLREYLGARNVIAVNSGTTALHIALDSFGVGEGDEVIVPSLTFCASVQVITALKARPVFCEINPDTLNMDVEDVKKRITKKTKAIMPVHYCGNACDMDALLRIGREQNILIIEDAAHAFGSSYQGEKIGQFGDVTCFSFDPIKNITCGEGGAVVLSNDDIAEEIRRKRILGIDKDTWHRYKNQRSWFYEVTTQGYRYHMSNINAAIGLIQLKKINAFIEKKRNIIRLYNKRFKDLKGVKLLKWNLNETAPFSYIIRILDGRRNEAMDYLEKQGIGSGVHYIANHTQPFFSDYYEPLPITEEICSQIMTIPLYYDMRDDDIDQVIQTVVGFANA